MDAEQDELDADLDRLTRVHRRPRSRVVLVEQERQQPLLVRRVPERVAR